MVVGSNPAAPTTHGESNNLPMDKKTILVTGATGFIGQKFCISAKRKGYEVIALSRNKTYAKTRLDQIRIISSLFELQSDIKIDYVLNLAGQPLVSGRWSNTLKASFISSRVDTTDSLFEYFRKKNYYPEVFISGSAVGYYGPHGDEYIDETSICKESFTHKLCSLWENSALKFEVLGSRVCCLRIGIVLGKGEGALKSMVTPFKLGLGGKLGNGKQWFPWIHIKDQVDIIFHCIECKEISGALNSCSPNPITNGEFTTVLGKILSRPTYLSMPSFLAKVIFGEMAKELLLKGQRAVPVKALDSGYCFTYNTIQQAIGEIFKN
ncbi:MAG: TIGR01777 family protein [Porticoccus sp.]|nr:TIGR01777 family protein [Porticoccus sp.]